MSQPRNGPRAFITSVRGSSPSAPDEWSSPKLPSALKGGSGSAKHPAPFGVSSAKFETRFDLAVAHEGPYADHRLDVTYTNSRDVAERFVGEHCARCRTLGFDLEHRPTFRPGQKANVSLLQFAPLTADGDRSPVLVYSLYHDDGRVPAVLLALLRDPAVAKVGVGIRGDVRNLGFLALSDAAKAAFHELSPGAAAAGLVDRPSVGLKALISACLGEACTFYKTKTLTMTNWETLRLSEAQVKYAAMDAWAAVACFEVIRRAGQAPR